MNRETLAVKLGGREKVREPAERRSAPPVAQLVCQSWLEYLCVCCYSPASGRSQRARGDIDKSCRFRRWQDVKEGKQSASWMNGAARIISRDECEWLHRCDREIVLCTRVSVQIVPLASFSISSSALVRHDLLTPPSSLLLSVADTALSSERGKNQSHTLSSLRAFCAVTSSPLAVCTNLEGTIL